MHDAGCKEDQKNKKAIDCSCTRDNNTECPHHALIYTKLIGEGKSEGRKKDGLRGEEPTHSFVDPMLLEPCRILIFEIPLKNLICISY